MTRTHHNCLLRYLWFRLLIAALTGAVLATAASAQDMKSGAMQPDGMKMKPAHFKLTRSAYTTNHAFLVKMTSLPSPIPYQDYFTLRFAVYDGHQPDRQLTDTGLALFAGMRHGMKKGFAHGMQSTPKIERKNGIFTVQGMHFHMMGKWTLKLTVSRAGRQGIAYFDLPCCGK
jgi:hypothetical protein